MLKTIHKHHRSVFVYVIMGLVMFAMLGFGVDFMTPRQSDYAIKIGEEEISRAFFEQERRLLMDVYRQRFGPNYIDLLEAQGVSVNQLLLDRIIPERILEQLVRQLGFVAGEAEIVQLVAQSIGVSPLTSQIYEQFLRSVGLSGREFESRVNSEAVQEQFSSLIEELSQAGLGEAEALLRHEKTEVTASYLFFHPDDILAEVEEPSQDVLEDFFANNAVRFERPREVEYHFLTIDPIDFREIVTVSRDDIELYYTENQLDYMSASEILPRAPIPLAEVEEEIREIIQRREAPAYAALKMTEWYDAWLGSGASLKEWAEGEELTVNESGGAVQEGAEPLQGVPNGLTAEVFRAAPARQLQLELGNLSFLVEVKQYEEAAIPPLSEISQQVSAVWREGRAKEVARERAQLLIIELSSHESPDPQETTIELTSSWTEISGLSRAQREAPEPFDNPQLATALFSIHRPGELSQEPIEADGGFYVLKVSSITPPENLSAKEKHEYRQRASEENAHLFERALVERLKAEWDISIAPWLLAE